MRTLLLLICVASPLLAGSVQNLKWKRDYALAEASVEDHYEEGLVSIGNRDWQTASRELRIVRDHFPDSDQAREAAYHLGIVEFERGEYDIANEFFSTYLQEESMPQHLEEIFELKFRIAEAFKGGYRKRTGGWRGMPRWQRALEDALEIYQDVATAMPSSDLAARSIFAQAEILQQRREMTESVEKYQALINRFPKHELAPESFAAISKLYHDKIVASPQDPDALPLAQLNLRRFRQAYPLDDRLQEAEDRLDGMKEQMASALVETARYYLKKKQPKAAYVYYTSAQREFPHTEAAELAERGLAKLGEIEL